MSDDSVYHGREQSLVKHLILRRYLQRFAYIIGSKWQSITYVDCFAGPWNSRSEDLADTSFSIAIHELREARNQLQRSQHAAPLQFRCVFLESNRAAFLKLDEFAKSIGDVQIETHNATLEQSVQEIVRFVRTAQGSNFSFVFIDPTGWTGFDIAVIRPLLTLSNCEVLINFMTEHIRRFIDWPNPANQESFERLFGDASFREEIAKCPAEERDDACVEKYMQVVQAAGKFGFASCAVVLHPEIDRSHFHLIYLTRHRKGIEVFKDAERKSMQDMEASRAQAQQRKRIKKTRQTEMFSGEDVPSAYFDELRDVYLGKAKKKLSGALTTAGRMDYDIAWSNTLRFPLVWESDLKEWIGEWQRGGNLELRGLTLNERVPKLGKQVELHWIPNSTNSPS